MKVLTTAIRIDISTAQVEGEPGFLARLVGGDSRYFYPRTVATSTQQDLVEWFSRVIEHHVVDNSTAEEETP